MRDCSSHLDTACLLREERTNTNMQDRFSWARLSCMVTGRASAKFFGADHSPKECCINVGGGGGGWGGGAVECSVVYITVSGFATDGVVDYIAAKEMVPVVVDVALWGVEWQSS